MLIVALFGGGDEGVGAGRKEGHISASAGASPSDGNLGGPRGCGHSQHNWPLDTPRICLMFFCYVCFLCYIYILIVIFICFCCGFVTFVCCLCVFLFAFLMFFVF